MAVQANRKPQQALATPKKASKTAGALAAAQVAATEAKQKRKRTKQGCITCRVRGKKCDEVRNEDGTCNTCNRLRIHCLGFVDRRPEWLRTKENIKVWRKRVTDFLLSQGFVKGYAGCGLRSANVPERRLTLEEMREDLGSSNGDGSDDAEPLPPLTPRYPGTAVQAAAGLPHHQHHQQLHHSTRHDSVLSDPSLYYNGGAPAAPAVAAAPAWQQQQHHHQHHHPHYAGSETESNGSPPRQTPPLTDPFYPQRHPTPSTSISSSPALGSHQFFVPFPSPPVNNYGKDLADLTSSYSPPYGSYTSATLSPLVSPPLQYSHFVAPSGHLSAGPSTASTETSMAMTLVPRLSISSALSHSSESASPPEEQLMHYNVFPNPPMYISPSTTFNQDYYIHRYFEHVLGIQYRLADQPTLRFLMSQLASTSPAVKSSISLLSVLHIQSQVAAAPRSPVGKNGVAGLLPAAPSKSAQALYDQLYAHTRKLLNEAPLRKGRFDEGDAMACLHVISAFLFSGGRGVWDEFLHMAGDWVEAAIHEYGESPLAALVSMSPMGRFIFRTTMWMDIFSGVSVCRPPRFLHVYQKLFRPEMRDAMQADDMGMDRVMGCPNEVILAFAETAQLEYEKRRSEELGAAAVVGVGVGVGVGGGVGAGVGTGTGPAAGSHEVMRHYVRGKGMHIEAYIPEVMGPAALPWERFVELKDADDTAVTQDTVDEERRIKVAEVFKHAARVYLHSVIEGCDPQVPAIRRAVIASIQALTALRSSPLDRALIFPLTITGCLAATQAEVEFCNNRLASVGNDANSFGNCLQARELITAVWAKRAAVGLNATGIPLTSQSISWRHVMRELGEDPLLLV